MMTEMYQALETTAAAANKKWVTAKILLRMGPVTTKKVVWKSITTANIPKGMAKKNPVALTLSSAEMANYY